MGEVADEQHDESASARPFFSRTDTPIGIYNGEQAIIVYEPQAAAAMANILDTGISQAFPPSTRSGTQS